MQAVIGWQKDLKHDLNRMVSTQYNSYKNLYFRREI